MPAASRRCPCPSASRPRDCRSAPSSRHLMAGKTDCLRWRPSSSGCSHGSHAGLLCGELQPAGNRSQTERNTIMPHYVKILAGTALLSLSLATSALAQNVTLRFNLWLPPSHFIVTDIIGGWAAEVERVTEGRVKVRNTTTSLGAPPRQY